jgi:guanylate kinase
MEDDDQVVHPVSVTTRPPRNKEADGEHYWFVGVEEFRRRVEEGEFIEWADVHGNLYGTLHSEVTKHVDAGRDVVLELDIQGMRSVKAVEPSATTVFIMAPSLEVLELRIRERGGLDESQIAMRMKNAEIEMKAKDEYDYIIVNDILDDAVSEFKKILAQLRQR